MEYTGQAYEYRVQANEYKLKSTSKRLETRLMHAVEYCSRETLCKLLIGKLPIWLVK